MYVFIPFTDKCKLKKLLNAKNNYYNHINHLIVEKIQLFYKLF